MTERWGIAAFVSARRDLTCSAAERWSRPREAEREAESPRVSWAVFCGRWTRDSLMPARGARMCERSRRGDLISGSARATNGSLRTRLPNDGLGCQMQTSLYQRYRNVCTSRPDAASIHSPVGDNTGLVFPHWKNNLNLWVTMRNDGVCSVMEEDS